MTAVARPVPTDIALARQRLTATDAELREALARLKRAQRNNLEARQALALVDVDARADAFHRTQTNVGWIDVP